MEWALTVCRFKREPVKKEGVRGVDTPMHTMKPDYF